MMLAGGRLETTCDGGVLERFLSFALRPSNGSADNESRSVWGTVFPKSSLRKTREYIRFASSARVNVSCCWGKFGREGIRTLLKMEFGVWSALLSLRRGRRTAVLVKQAVSSLQVLPFAIWNESVNRHIILLAQTPRKCTSQVGAGDQEWLTYPHKLAVSFD